MAGKLPGVHRDDSAAWPSSSGGTPRLIQVWVLRAPGGGRMRRRRRPMPQAPALRNTALLVNTLAKFWAEFRQYVNQGSHPNRAVPVLSLCYTLGRVVCSISIGRLAVSTLIRPSGRMQQ